MNSRRLRVGLVALGLAIYLAGLVAFVPAGWLAPLLERASGGALTLGDAHGTIWSGEATLAIRSGGLHRALARIEWRCNPLWAITGRLRVAVAARATEAELRATLQLRSNELRIEDLQAAAPAALIESVLPIAAIAGPEGRLRLRAQAIVLTHISVAGTATLDWENAGFRQWQWSELGDYRIEATGQGPRAQLRLATLRGDLQMVGTGEWRIDRPRALQLSGTAENAGHRKDLDLFLRMIGRGATGPRAPFMLSLPAG